MTTNTEHTYGPGKAGHALWKALLGGVVSIAMIAGTNAVVAYANPTDGTGETATSQAPANGADANNGSGEGTGSNNGSGNGGSEGNGSTGDNSGNGNNGNTGNNGSDNGSTGGNGNGNGSEGNNGNGSEGNGSGGNQNPDTGDTVAAPTSATLDGPAYAATFKEKDAAGKDVDVTYKLVNGDDWSVKITAPGAAQVHVSGWYSLDGTSACATAEEQGVTAKCAQVPADKSILSNPDENGVFTFKPGDGVYGLAGLEAKAFDADGKASAAVKLSDLTGAEGSTLKNVAKLAVDTDASKGTTLAAATKPLKNGLASEVTGFTIANASPLFALRTRILAAQAAASKPELLVNGTKTFGDAIEATQGKDGKYALTIDAAQAGKDAFAKDAAYTVSLNGTALGAGAAQTSTTFTIDNAKPAKPAKLGIVLNTDDQGNQEPVLKSDDGEWLVNGGHALTVTPAEDTAGIAEVTVLDKDGKKVADLKAATDGTYHWQLAADAEYDLSEYQVTVTDNAGLVSDPVKLNTVTRADGFTATKVIVATTDPAKNKITFAVAGDLKPGGTYNSIDGVTLSNKQDQFFAKRVELLAKQMGNSTAVEVVNTADGSVVDSYAANLFQPGEDGTSFSLTFKQPLKAGKYSIRLTADAIRYLGNVDPQAIENTVDDVAPTISKVSLATDAGATFQLDGKTLYVNATQSAPRVVVEASDDVSGVAKVTINAQFRKLNADGTLGDAEAKTIDAQLQENGTWVATLTEQGAYEFATARVDADDNAENTGHFDFATAAEGTLDFADTTLFVSTSVNKDADFAVTIATDPAAGKTNKINGVRLNSTSPWFRQIVENLPKDASGSLVVANGTSDTGAAYALTAGTVNGKDRKFSLQLVTTTFDGLDAAKKNGNHTLTVAAPFTGDDKTFLFDDTAATVTGFSYGKADGAEDSVEDGELITGDGDVKRTLTFTVQDLLPGSTDANAAQGKVSGVKTVTAAFGSGSAQPLADNGQGKYTLTLDKPGTYVLSNITISAQDNTGNETARKSVAQLIKDLGSDQLKDVTSITIADVAADATITTTILVNGKTYDVPADKAAYLSFRGEKPGKLPTVTLRVKGNKNFERRWKSAVKANVPVLTSTLTTADGKAQKYGALVLDKYKQADDGSYVISLKVAEGSKDLLSKDDNGLYTVSLNTDAVNGNNALAQLLGRRGDNGEFAVDKDGEYMVKPFSIGIDNVEPSFTALTYTADKNDLTGTVKGERRVLANGAREISFSAHDLFVALKNDQKGGQTKDDANVAGLLTVTAKVKVEGFDGKTKTEDLKLQGDGGNYTVKLGENGDGIYKLSNVEIVVSDNAKKFVNTDDTGTEAYANTNKASLAQIKKQLGATNVPDQLAVSASNGTAETLVNGKPVAEQNQYYTKDIESVAIKVTDDPAFAYRSEILKAAYGKTNVFDGSSLTYSTTVDGKLSATIADADIDTKAATLTWSGDKINALLPKLDKAISKDKTQKNGNYALVTKLTAGEGENVVTLLASPKDVHFTLDEVAPVIAKATAAPGKAGTSIVEGYEVKGKKYDIYAAAGAQQVQVTVKDVLPEGQRATGIADNDAVKDEIGTSGIDDKSVTFSVPAPTDLEGKEIGDAVTNKPATGYDAAKGIFTITLDQEGFYDLSKITVTIADRAGNVQKDSTILEPLTGQKGNKIGYTAIVADVKNDNKVAVTINYDGPEPANGPKGNKQDYYFYRGTITNDYTVTDKWFPLYQRLTDVNNGNLLNNTAGNTSPQTGTETQQAKGVTVNTAGWTKTGEYTWSLKGQKLLLQGNSEEVEGKYDLHFEYSGLQSDTTGDSRFFKDFVLDWTAPQLGNLTSSVTSPAKWNWIFATTGVTVTLDGVNDPISGICSINAGKSAAAAGVAHDCASTGDESVQKLSKLGFDNRIADAEAHPAPAVTYAGTTAGGSISFGFDGDSQRLTLGDTSIGLTDAAGNPVDTGALNKYEGVNGTKAENNVKGVEGIAIDTVAPTLAIAYDNNDVRNGKYYKAHRTGTVTLVESNFDFSLKNEPDRVVVTDTVDGAVRTVPVSAFTNPNGDRKTYVATFAADRDGDWVIDASYTDPGDHAANTIHEEFTVDTVAPVLELTFDNNNVKNGMYYAADRHATVRETERNFSEGESVITTTAADDKGASQSAPAAAGWTRTGGERESTQWTNTVAFTGELHYTIKAVATDLAGNVAQEVSAPEFVIDKTKPSIKIERVEDKTAYAGTVAPLIDTDDTNLDAKQIKWTLVGAHRGELKDKKLPQSTTKDSDNTQTVDFSDFERKAEIDDVYTLTAEATDMAGNTFKVAKTFSANRFGSTYTFNAGTQNLRGTYLKKSEPVIVTEINVSGLQPGKSNVVVAKNASAHQLAEGEYSVKTGDDKGWSSTVYTIPAKEFAQDGFYRVQLTSTDKAGNLSQNTMNEKDTDRKGGAEVNFALDTTAPTAHALNIESGAVYYDQNGRNVGVDAKDNLDLDSAEIAVDGEVQATWKGSTLLDTTPSFRLPADGARHEITVTSVDKAGNKAVSNYDNVYVASNWWQYAMNTSWIRNTLIFGTIIVLAAIAGAIVAFTRRRNADPLATV